MCVRVVAAGSKTTLVDRVLRDCNVSITSDRVMDRNELEKERGITIMSKVTSVTHGEHRINGTCWSCVGGWWGGGGRPRPRLQARGQWASGPLGGVAAAFTAGLSPYSRWYMCVTVRSD